jgi:AraC-like DNA-binding protein
MDKQAKKLDFQACSYLLETRNPTMNSILPHLQLENMPRLFPHSRQLSAAGYCPMLNRIFSDKPVIHPTLNFGLILSSNAEYIANIDNGIKYTSKIPCMVVRIPGHTYQNLIPTVDETLFFSYDKSLIPSFLGMNIQLEPVFRHIVITSQLSEHLRQLLRLMTNIHDYGNLDRIDRLAENMIIEAMFSSGDREEISMMEKTVRKIASEIEIGYTRKLDLAELLEKYKISKRTFTRYWMHLHPIPYSKYINKLRIEEAKRLLVSDSIMVNEIARKVGFDDPYYFMRKFRQLVGMTPKTYRARSMNPAHYKP